MGACVETVFVLNGLQGTDLNVAGQSAAAMTLGRVRGLFPEPVLLLPEGGSFPGSDEVTVLRPSRPDVHTVFSGLLDKYPDAGVFLFGDLYSPLLQPELGEKFARMTIERIAHYTYGEHYPLGVAPHALSRECVQVLRNVASGNYTTMDDEAFMDLMGLDINNYDIEVDVSPEDFRRYRLDLRARGPEQVRLLANIAGAAGRSLGELDYPALTAILTGRPEVLRTLPSYVEMDLSENCALRCDFCPREAMGLSGKTDGEMMDEGLAVTLVDELADLNPRAWLALSPYSEPFEYYGLVPLVGHALDRGLKVVLETNGLGLDANAVAWLGSLPDEQIVVIVSLDVLSGGEYGKYKGEDRFDSVVESIRALAAVKPVNTYIQVLNMDELSSTIDGFYDFWKDHQDRVLPRKYNSFCGRLPERSTTDLSPLTRFPCWHLKRDMVIRHDGRVTLCKQDLDGEWFSADAGKEGLAAVWEKLGEYYLRHVTEPEWGFPGCASCDEWHTYNF